MFTHPAHDTNVTSELVGERTTTPSRPQDERYSTWRHSTQEYSTYGTAGLKPAVIELQHIAYGLATRSSSLQPNRCCAAGPVGRWHLFGSAGEHCPTAPSSPVYALECIPSRAIPALARCNEALALDVPSGIVGATAATRPLRQRDRRGVPTVAHRRHSDVERLSETRRTHRCVRCRNATT